MLDVIAKKLPSRVPYGVIIPLFTIVGIGIINLSSAARATRPELYLSQLVRFALAVVLLASAAFMHTRIVRRLAFLVYIGVVFMLVMVLAVGHSAKGAERWLVLGWFRIQPSDPAKVALILAMARYCSMNWPEKGYSILSLARPLNISRPLGFLALMVMLLTNPQYAGALFSDQMLTSSMGMSIMVGLVLFGFIWLLLALLRLYQNGFAFESFVAPVDVPLIPFLLICVEPDLATGLVVLGTAGIMLLYVGIQRSSLVLGVAAFMAISVLAYNTVLMDYQKQRIISFLNPESDLKGDGYHAMQSIIAVGSGRIIGKGYSGGTQTQLSFLPENATDFVFSVWAEEWGFIACAFLLGLYFVLLYSILKVGARVEDKFSQLLCVGVTAYIFLHVLVNVGMVTGVLPVAGVPLPLMSYGGSSMNVTFIGIGLVANVALWRGEK